MSTSKNRFKEDLNDSFGWISSRITQETIKLRKVERKIERSTSDRVVSCQFARAAAISTTIHELRLKLIEIEKNEQKRKHHR
jgi:hypothetical protein